MVVCMYWAILFTHEGLSCSILVGTELVFLEEYWEFSLSMRAFLFDSDRNKIGFGREYLIYNETV